MIFVNKINGLKVNAAMENAVDRLETQAFFALKPTQSGS
jgi:hypothetical protein